MLSKILMNPFLDFLEITAFSEFYQHLNHLFLLLPSFFAKFKIFFLQSRLFSNTKNNADIMVELKSAWLEYAFI